MTALKGNKSPVTAATYRFLPALLILFLGSGCAALIYEIVWLQLLQLVIGSSAVSLAVLLGTFMGGMCLGSLAVPGWIPAHRHPLRVYAILEIGIGLMGLVILVAMPYIDRAYAAGAGGGFSGIFLRAAVAALCLLPPTMLMGATLPAVARWVEASPQGVSWLGFFYGANIAGAVLGCLVAGFYLLRVHDMATAVYVAALINGSVALIAILLARQTSSLESAVPVQQTVPNGVPNAWPVYVTIAMSGLCALGAEVIWTRVLSLMLGATVYTFSIILAVFLAGLGLGSSIGSSVARSVPHPRLALACCQILLAAAIGWTAYMLAESLPYWPINPSLSRSVWHSFQLDVVRCVWAVLPATVLWGASFPLALAAVASPGQDAGRLVGRVYAANTAGAIAGAIGSSLLLIPQLGTRRTQQVLIVLSAAAGLLMIFTSWLWPVDSSAEWRKVPRSLAFLALSAGTAVVAIVAARMVPAVPGELVAWGRQLPSRSGEADVLYVGEGMNSSVAVSLRREGTRNFHVSGKIEASSLPEDMRLQRMLGHIPALLHRQPRSVLVVGCGAGVTAGTFVLHPNVERIVICEIEPLIPKAVTTYFSQENYDVLHDPRVEVVYDDARHYVLTTQEKFDIITSDPIHPWVKGAATLYTKEYFEMCKRRLNPGGLITQWVPLYESNLDAVRSEIATFFEVFPNGSIWGNCIQGEGYDVVMLGQAAAGPIDIDELERRWDRDDYVRVARSLEAVGFSGPLDLLATYAGQGPDLQSWLQGAEINRDRNLRLQYLAGMGLNFNFNPWIYREMLAHRRFHDRLFIGSELQKETLRQMLNTPP
jgi:spermidine synthase